MADALRSLAFEHLLTPGGWLSPGELTFEAATGAITAVATASRPAGVRRGFAVPGLPNLHSHAFQRAMAGFAERRGGGDFWAWREAMYSVAERIGPDDVQAIAAQAYVEMVKAGFTAVAEFHYLHHDPEGAPYADPAELSRRVLAAAAEVGIGITLLPVLYLHGGFGRLPATARQRRFVHGDVAGYVRLVEKLVATAGEGVTIGIAPHSLRAATPPDMAAALVAADAVVPGCPVHVHVAEQQREVDECVAEHGLRPVALLFDKLPVDSRWCLVHATHVDGDELAALAQSGAVAGLCPITEANLGDGLFPARELVDAGGHFGVGSDSNVAIDATGELRQLEYGQRLHRRARAVLAEGNTSTGTWLWSRAAAGGGRALGQERGTLAPGAACDVVVLDPSHPALVGHGRHSALDALLFGGASGAVRDVWVGGRQVVGDGRHRAEERILSAFRATMSRLWNSR